MVVCSVLERCAAETERRLARVPSACGLVEIRADHLPISDVEGLVRGCGRPVIVTVRGAEDGGEFSGSPDERRRIMAAALDGGARFIDVELDGPLAELADGDDAERVILSHHGAECSGAALAETYRRLASHGAAVLKLVPCCESAAEIGAVREALAVAARDGRRLACFAMGRPGVLSRILAPSWGSWATYGSAAATRETAPGQLTVTELIEVYDVLGIADSTRLFALIGSDVLRSPSPAMHRAGYLAAGIDARYVPLEIDDVEECLLLLGAKGAARIDGLGVTMPFKEDVADRCWVKDEIATRSGAVNTVVFDRGAWSGRNTDGPALLGLVRRHIDPAGTSAAVVGAGGTARVAASVLRDAGADVVLYNRSPDRARKAAARLGVRSRPLEQLSGERWDLLVQATPLGRAGERFLPGEALHGRLVVDAVYGVETPLLAAARARGLATVDGLDLLVSQAVLQFEHLVGRRPDEGVLRRAAIRWLDDR
jgi:3-dehydroquinate dehydratase/shikimate dehydrogenase